MNRGWRQAIVIGAVLAAGGLGGAALYWAFLNTPESNVWMLALSAVLAVAMLAIVSVAVNTAILVARDVGAAEAVSRGVRGMGWFVLIAGTAALAWVGIGAVDGWFNRHAGEINAWFIARFGWADITPLLQAEQWTSRWLRFVALPVTGVSLLTALLTGGGAGSRWLRRAWHWRTLAIATLAFALLVALPWQLTAWRPSVPATWMAPATAALRLGVAVVLAACGAAVIVLAAARDRA